MSGTPISVLILVENPPLVGNLALNKGGVFEGFWRSDQNGVQFFRACGGLFTPVYTHFGPPQARKNRNFEPFCPLKTTFFVYFFGRAFGAHLYSKSPCYTAQMMRAEGAPRKFLGSRIWPNPGDLGLGPLNKGGGFSTRIRTDTVNNS